MRLHEESLAFLLDARERTEEQLQSFQQFRCVMQRVVNYIPHEGGKFLQDPLEKDLLRGFSEEGIHWLLSEQVTEGRLRALLKEIDQKISALTQGRSPAEESSAQQQKPAA